MSSHGALVEPLKVNRVVERRHFRLGLVDRSLPRRADRARRAILADAGLLQGEGP
jgi:hypothetical protein